MNPESIYYLFEVGKQRKQEDYVWPIPGKATVNDKVFIVCDGVGSFDSGQIASKLIGQFMAAKILKFDESKISDELINKSLAEARDRLVSYCRAYRLDTHLATTFSMLVLYDQKVLISWFGDSRIFHLRGGEILLKTEDNSLEEELPLEDETIDDSTRLRKSSASRLRGIVADSSPIHAQTIWIEDVKNGDYFLICSKGLLENVTEDDIRSLLKQNRNENIDLAGSINQLAIERTQDNYSMYLIRINMDLPRRSRIIRIPSKKQLARIKPLSVILAMTIIGMLIIFFYFRRGRPSDTAPKNTYEASQPQKVIRNDSAPVTIIKQDPAKSTSAVADSAKINDRNAEATTHNDDSADTQIGENEQQADQPPESQNISAAQLLLKFTTNESCKLRIKNIDLNEVIEWDLSRNDNGTIYLKPGNYLIAAKSVIDSTKIKSYLFYVKSGHSNASQNLRINF